MNVNLAYCLVCAKPFAHDLFYVKGHLAENEPHLFHPECIEDRIRYFPHCSICRIPMNPSDLLQMRNPNFSWKAKCMSEIVSNRRMYLTICIQAMFALCILYLADSFLDSSSVEVAGLGAVAVGSIVCDAGDKIREKIHFRHPYSNSHVIISTFSAGYLARRTITDSIPSATGAIVLAAVFSFFISLAAIKLKKNSLLAGAHLAAIEVAAIAAAGIPICKSMSTVRVICALFAASTSAFVVFFSLLNFSASAVFHMAD